MARLPRFPPSLEHLSLIAASRLPGPAHNAVFGRPPVIDGVMLDREMHATMRLSERAGRATLTGGLPPEMARAEVRRDCAAGAGPPRPVAAIRHLEWDGPGGTQPARLYLPFGAAPAPRPLLLYFHGGGWIVGGVDTHDSVCRFLATHAGVAVLSCGYRLAPEHPYPAAVEDERGAYEWVLANAAELEADPERIAVGGDSAGGNMATGVCQVARDEGLTMPAMQLLIYPVTDSSGVQESRRLFAEGFKLTAADIEYCERLFLPDPSCGDDALASVLRAPDLSRLPPAYIATAGFDPLRDEGEQYAHRLRDEGVRVALRRHSGLIHTFANMTGYSRSARAAMLEAAGALRRGLA